MWAAMVFLGLWGATCGCVRTAPMYVSLVHRGEIPLVDETAALDNSSSILVVHVHDARTSRESIGRTTWPVFSDNVVPWVQEGFAALADHGYRFAPDPGHPPPGATRLDVAIDRVWCRGALMIVRSTVSMSVRYTSSRATVERQYVGLSRVGGSALGSQTGHSSSRVMRSLNSALNQALADFEHDLRAFCRGEELPDTR